MEFVTVSVFTIHSKAWNFTKPGFIVNLKNMFQTNYKDTCMTFNWSSSSAFLSSNLNICLFTKVLLQATTQWKFEK